MANFTRERHRTLKSRGLNTLLRKDDRISLIRDGYGDFCFAHKPFDCFSCSSDESFPWHRNLMMSRTERMSYLSAGFVAEHPIDSSIVLPLLELPHEIRKVIFQYLVQPFRNKHGMIQFNFGIVLNRPCHPFRSGYEVYLPVMLNDDGDRIPLPGAKHTHIRRHNYDTIRALSQTNHQIRQELGEAFWKSIDIDIDHWELLFTDFLEDRPKVASSISKLRMSWDSDEAATDLDDMIIDFCNHVSKCLDLDVMEFVLCTSSQIAQQIIASEGKLKWILAFRKIKMKKVEVELFLSDMEDEEEDDFSSSDEDDNGSEASNHDDGNSINATDSNGGNAPTASEPRRATRTESLARKIEELLLPAPRVVAVTDQEAYIASRNNDV